MDTGLQIVTSTALASVIVKLLDVWLERKKRKDAVEDKEAEKLEGDLRQNGKKLESLSEAVRLLVYDKFEFLASKAVAANEVTLKQYRVISGLYDSYKALGGDGWADELMELVKALEVRQ